VGYLCGGVGLVCRMVLGSGRNVRGLFGVGLQPS
jgi:hypothetical protein